MPPHLKNYIFKLCAELKERYVWWCVRHLAIFCISLFMYKLEIKVFFSHLKQINCVYYI